MREPSSPLRSLWLYSLWSCSFLAALGFSLGLTPALRGAGVGLGTWIDRADAAAAILSQIIAVTGSVLLVGLIVESARQAGRRPASGLIAVLTMVQGLVLLVAVEGPVQESLANFNVIALLLAGALVIVTRLAARPESAVFPTLAWTALAARFGLSFGENSPHVAAWLGGASLLSGAIALGMVLYDAWPRTKAPLRPVSVAAISSGPDTLSRIFSGPLDPSLLVAAESVPGVAVGLACSVPVAFWLGLDAYRRGTSPGRALLLASSVTPISPLTLAGASIGFLLMSLEPIKQKIR
jgi:hypothetical protein